jgi:hypothetical protein
VAGFAIVGEGIGEETVRVGMVASRTEANDRKTERRLCLEVQPFLNVACALSRTRDRGRITRRVQLFSAKSGIACAAAWNPIFE